MSTNNPQNDEEEGDTPDEPGNGANDGDQGPPDHAPARARENPSEQARNRRTAGNGKSVKESDSDASAGMKVTVYRG